MNINENLNLKGNITVLLFENNKLIKKYNFNNVITIQGRNLIRNFLQGNISNKVSYLQIGTGTSSPSLSDTKLNNEIYRISITNVDTSTDRLLKLQTFIPSTVSLTQNLIELGLFMGTASNTLNTEILLSRQLFPTQITKSSTQSLYIEWNITI